MNGSEPTFPKTRRSKSAEESRLAEMQRLSAMTVEERMGEALRLGMQLLEIQQAAKPK